MRAAMRWAERINASITALYVKPESVRLAGFVLCAALYKGGYWFQSLKG